ncbi:hypothetical protein L6470_04495 [Prevotella communis]|uniref:hypothetical protein n=1 Tax=Prevotella communis TaxID=2913614 RepID=UPI001EDB19FB|nr:hypothetical protein [Prevotella communis]UKK60277.1 hypothetical protein L6470_04495 [Prevotella communis]
MKKIIYIFLLTFFDLCPLSAQAHRDSLLIVELDNIRDDFTNAVVKGGKAYVLTRDSLVVDSTEISDDGTFYLTVKRSIFGQTLIIKTINPDYEPQYNDYSMKYMGKKDVLYLPAIYMKRKTSFGMQNLGEVVVTATKVKMYYRGDTLVYNADAFNVADGSMLDALIKQMPGTELTKQGEIFVNGRKVENLLLNGKDFFRGNNKIMLENLPYYTVKEIKVYEQTTEKAIALHDAYSEKDFVMDVNLKREYSRGYIANMEIGVGTEDIYMARLFGLMYTDASRLAIVGGANNLNMGAYTIDGYAYRNGDREGRTDTKLLTAELLTDDKRRKNVLTVELSKKETEQGSDIFEETFHNTLSTFSTSRNSYINKNLGASLTNKYTFKQPLWVESTTGLRINDKKNDSDERYYESGTNTRPQGLAVLDSLFSIGVPLNDPLMKSALKRKMNDKTKEYGISQTIKISKNLFTTDIIDFSAGVDYTKSTCKIDRFNQYLIWQSGKNQTNITETVDHPNTHASAMADAALKNSRLFYDTQMEFHLGYQYNYEKDKEWITDGTSQVIDTENSYKRRMNENKYQMNMKYHYNHVVNSRKHLEINMLLPVSFIHRNTDYSRYTIDTCLIQKQVFFEPSLSLRYEKYKNVFGNVDWGISVSTSLKHALPDATQLITLPLTSDKINIYQGNAHLKSSSVWESELGWHLPIKGEMEEFFQKLTYTRYFNQIVSTYHYDSGIYTHTPANINGTWKLSFYSKAGHNFKIKKKDFHFSWTFNGSLRHMKNFVAEGVTGLSQEIDNDEVDISVPLYLGGTINKRIWASIRTGINWRKSLKDNGGVADREMTDFYTELEAELKLFADISFKTDCEFVKRNGYSDNSLNKWNCLWDISLSKSILRDKIGLTLKAIDILHQYKSLTYVINERGIRETHAIALPSYCLFSVTYKFHKEPKKK